jgi:DNA-binding transcriptional regulator YiaG
MQHISKAELSAQKALIKACSEAGVGIDGLEGMERFTFVPPPSSARDREALSEYAKPSKRQSFRPKCRNHECICHKSRWFRHCALMSGTGDYHIRMAGDPVELTEARSAYAEGNPAPLREWLRDNKTLFTGTMTPCSKRRMTPETFKAIRVRAGLSQSQLADVLRLSDKRTIRYWEAGERQISGPVSLLMELLDKGLLKGNLIGISSHK